MPHVINAKISIHVPQGYLTKRRTSILLYAISFFFGGSTLQVPSLYCTALALLKTVACNNKISKVMILVMMTLMFELERALGWSWKLVRCYRALNPLFEKMLC